MDHGSIDQHGGDAYGIHGLHGGDYHGGDFHPFQHAEGMIDLHVSGHATWEAVLISMDHGSGHSFEVSHVDAHTGVADHAGADLASLDRLDLNQGSFAQVLRGVRNQPGDTYVVHVSGHGQVEMFSVFARTIAKILALYRLDGVRATFSEQQPRSVEFIAPWNFFSGQKGGALPTGWFPGVKGRTTHSRQVWQIGKSTWGGVEYDATSFTYLEITWISWQYTSTADFESQFVVRVGANPIHDQAADAWGWLKEPFERHSKAAVRIIEWATQTLAAAKPSPTAMALRRQKIAQYGHNPAAQPDGLSVRFEPYSQEGSPADQDALVAAQRGLSGATSGGGAESGEPPDASVLVFELPD